MSFFGRKKGKVETLKSDPVYKEYVSANHRVEAQRIRELEEEARQCMIAYRTPHAPSTHLGSEWRDDPYIVLPTEAPSTTPPLYPLESA